MDSSAIRRAAEKADTGRWAPGYQDLSRYNTPGYCLAAIRGIQEATWRRGEMDTVAIGSPADTSSKAALDAGRKCAARLSIDKVLPLELYNFMNLLVMLNDTIRLDSLIAHQRSITTNDEEHAYFLTDAVISSIRNKPIRRNIMDQMFRRLDSLGPKAPQAWHDALITRRVEYYRATYDTAALWGENVEPWHRLLPYFPRDEKNNLALGVVFDSIEHVWYQRDTNLVEKVREFMERLFRSYSFSFSPEQQTMLIETAVLHASNAKKVLSSFSGGVWIPDTAGATFPTRGKVTVVYETRTPEIGLLPSKLAELRRLKHLFGDQLEVVLHVPSAGYVWGSPPLSITDEAKAIRWVYRDYFKLPFTIFVDETPVARRADGKLLRGAPPNKRKEVGAQYLYIIDKQQRLYHFWDNAPEARLRAYVKRAIEEKPVVSNTSRHSVNAHDGK